MRGVEWRAESVPAVPAFDGWGDVVVGLPQAAMSKEHVAMETRTVC